MVRHYLVVGQELVTDVAPHAVLVIDSVEAQMVVVDLNEAVSGGAVISYHYICVFR